MKCIHCSSILDEGTKYCPICGTEQLDNKIMYCPNCGKTIPINSINCPNCNCSINVSLIKNSLNSNTPDIVEKLIKALKSKAIVSIIYGSMALCVAFISIVIAFFSFIILAEDFEDSLIVAGICIFVFIISMVIGLVELFVGIGIIRKANRIKDDYCGIVDEYSFSNAIMQYIFSGIVIISLLASINCFSYTLILFEITELFIDIFAIRLFVKKNKSTFIALETFQSEINK